MSFAPPPPGAIMDKMKKQKKLIIILGDDVALLVPNQTTVPNQRHIRLTIFFNFFSCICIVRVLKIKN